MLSLSAIPALSDNYIWALASAAGDDTDQVAIVDPGEARPVQEWLAQHELRIGAIIATHHHPDHTGGIKTLLAQADADDIPVYGSKTDQDRIGQITHPLRDGDTLTLDWLSLTLSTIEVPGHTMGHIALHGGGILLAGDTLFRAGCGRVFEGTHQQMQAALARLRELDADTRVYAGHEYTQKTWLLRAPSNPATRRSTASRPRLTGCAPTANPACRARLVKNAKSIHSYAGTIPMSHRPQANVPAEL